MSRWGDAVVVLGAPLREDGALTPVVEERVRAGVALWREQLDAVLVMAGGITRCRSVAEADAMAEAAVALGVPRERIVVERESRSTRENARNVAHLILPQGKRQVWVVTQPFHLRRSLLWFRRAGFEARGWRIPGAMRKWRWILKEYGALWRDWWRH